MGKSEFDKSSRATPARAWFYFIVNALYASAFAIFVFAVWQDKCYTVNGTNTPVTKDTEGAVNTTANWNMIMFVGFLVYTLAACSAVSQCFTGVWGSRLQRIDRYTNYICFLMFIAIHITRITHSGAVCAGDYLEEQGLDKSNPPAGYLVGTGKFLSTFILIAWIVYPIFLIGTLLYHGPRGQIPALILDSPK